MKNGSRGGEEFYLPSAFDQLKGPQTLGHCSLPHSLKC
eukprot:jgi/Botrbrau1/6830/Bobra.0153s0025.1